MYVEENKSKVISEDVLAYIEAATKTNFEPYKKKEATQMVHKAKI